MVSFAVRRWLPGGVHLLQLLEKINGFSVYSMGDQ
jgi:hypothetical protein